MRETELSTSRITPRVDVDRIDALERWFRIEYPYKLNKINRYDYLGLPSTESRFSVEMEAYEKENELRILKGLQPLPATKFTNLF